MPEHLLLDFLQARSALPYARPNFIGMGAGGKTCSQCGTNRTPQWREGPEGALQAYLC